MKRYIMFICIVSILANMSMTSYAALKSEEHGEIGDATFFDKIENEETDTGSGSTSSRGSSGYDGLRKQHMTKNDSTTDKEAEKEDEVAADEDKPEESQETEVSNPFDDVTEADWYYNDVLYVYENGIMSGVDEKTFSPKTGVTRAMVITILHRTAGAPESGEADFTDVDSSSWYAKAVAWGAEKGIVSGTGEGQFSPDGAITREQLAVMLYNYRKLTNDTDKKAELTAYSDRGDISKWAEEAVSWAVANGIISGKSRDTIAPKDGATRAEAAAIIRRFMKLVEEI